MAGLDELRAKLNTEGVLVLSVKVMPRAAKSAVLGFTEDGSLKIKLAAIPEKGKANRELRRMLAEFFGVAQNNVEIISGDSSQHKRLKISR